MRDQDLTKVKWGIGALVAAVAAYLFWPKTTPLQPVQPSAPQLNTEQVLIARAQDMLKFIASLPKGSQLSKPGQNPQQDLLVSNFQGAWLRSSRRAKYPVQESSLWDWPTDQAFADVTGWSQPVVSV